MNILRQAVFFATFFLGLLLTHAQDTIPNNLNQRVTEFLNNYDSSNIDHTKTPGWTTAVYQKDSLSLTLGYGYTSIDTQEKVTADAVFRLASVSKIFTAIAVMQLVEQGKVSLSEDIQNYVPFNLNLKYAVTLKQLLTHTAGFEDKFYGDSSLDRENMQELGDHLLYFLPKQVYVPGEIIAYSNYGNALAAYIVEAVTKTPFWKYVDAHILKPLDMQHSGYMLNANLENKLVSGYDYTGNTLVKQPYSWVHRYPASSMLSTSEDMLKLIEALLNDGIGKKGRILSKESINTMFSSHFSQDEELPGMSLAWMPFLGKNGETGFWHDGSMLGYHASLVILPEKKAGYFIASNSRYRNITFGLRYALVNNFFNNPPKQHLTPTENILFDDFSGHYVSSRKNYTTFEKMASLLSTPLSIVKSDKGMVWGKTTYLPMLKNKFISDSGHILVFEKDKEGRTLMHTNIYGAPTTYIKQGYLETSKFHFYTIIVLLVLSLLLCVIHTYTYIVHKKRDLIWILITQYLQIVFFGFTFFLLSSMSGTDIRFGEVTSLKIAVALPIISVIFLAISFKKWQRSILYSISLISSVMLLFWAYYWNILGWNF